MKLIFILSTLIAISSAALVPVISTVRQLRCNYMLTHHSLLLHNTYTCEVSGSYTINVRGHQISSIVGSHLSNKSNNDVLAFKADAARFEYFPNGLNKFFQNLQSIVINYSRLREIRQIDLKPFDKLRYLELFDNKIESLEADLFKFNRNIEVIWLSSNNIKEVDWTSFDGMKKLTNLYMGDNICISQSADNVGEVQALIAKIKVKCQPSDEPQDPNLTTTPEPDDSTLPPNANETSILIRKLYKTEDEVDRLKKKREELLIKWTRAEEERDKLRENQTDLLAQFDECQKLSQALNSSIKDGDRTAITYIREATQLRNEIRTQISVFERINNGYRSQVQSINATLIAVRKEKAAVETESKNRLYKITDYMNKYDDLLAAKERDDLIMFIVIGILSGVLILTIAPMVYGKFNKKQKPGFNSFENSMRVRMGEVALDN